MTETNIIIGAGQAGAWAAVAMRQAGFTGRILLIGEEAHRPYERPPLSKAVLLAPEEPPVLYFHTEERYRELNIELMLGVAATAIDPAAKTVRLADSRVLSYDRLLLATGGRARHLPIPGGELVHYLRTLDEARALRAALPGAKRVVCIGAGVIGLEIASSAASRGAEVTVLEAAGTVMGRSLSPEGAAFVAGIHRESGVDLILGAAVSRIERNASGALVVHLGDGREIGTDLVVAGVGMTRNLELATAIGLDIDGGIVVDEFGRTGMPDIYAAGDVTAFWHPRLQRRLRLESWQHAQNQGQAAGRAMAGELKPYEDVPWFWSDQHGANIQVAGFPGEAVRTVVRPGASAATLAAFHLGADGEVIGVTAVDEPRAARAGQSMIRLAKPVDPVALVDPAVPLQKLAK